MVDLTKLSELKRLTSQALDFHDGWRYFFENFCEKSSFHDCGIKTDYPLLKQAITQTGANYFKQSCHLTGFVAIELRDYYFFHGCCALNGHLGCYYYFDDIKVGMMALSNSPELTAIELFRFKLVKVDCAQVPVNQFTKSLH